MVWFTKCACRYGIILTPAHAHPHPQNEKAEKMIQMNKLQFIDLAKEIDQFNEA
jgi:hypothetical protein